MTANSETRRNLIPPKLCVALIVFAFLLFSNTINRYFLMDDFDIIYSVRSYDLRNALLGYDTVIENRFFRPIPMFSFWLQNRVFGLNPAVFHATTIALHAATALAGANLFYLLFEELGTAALFAFLFVMYPNHAEVVNWPAINFTSWASLFYLLSLNMFVYYRLSPRILAFLGSLVFLLAAASSHELAITLPVSLVLADYFLLKSRGLKLSIGRRVLEYGICFSLLFTTLFLIRTYLHTGAGYLTPDGQDLISLYLKNPPVLVADFIRMSLRAWEYLIAPVSPEIRFHGLLITGALVLTACVLARLALLRRINLAACVYCFLFVTITGLPILGTFRVLTLTHWVRFIYLPSIGSAYMISMLVAGALAGVSGRMAKGVISGAILLPICLLTKFYDGQWIQAQAENERVVRTIVKDLKNFPEKSRIYVSDTPWMKDEIPRIDYALPCAAGLYCDRKNVEAALNFLPPHKVLVLEREPYTDGEWRYFWMRWDDKAGTLREMRPIQPAVNKQPFTYEWGFADASTQRYVNAVAGALPFFVKDSPYPFFMIDDVWALLWLPPADPTRPIKYVTIEMATKGKRLKKDVSRVFWTTESDSEITGGKSIGFYTLTDGEFHEYRIPMYRNGLSLIDPRIVRLAIRPSQTPGTVFCIRKMVIESY